MWRLIFVLAMLGATQVHAGLFVFSGGDGVPFKLSLDGLEAVKENGKATVRLSLRIEEVSKPVKSAGIRCEGNSTNGDRWSFSAEIANLKIDETRDLVLDGTSVDAAPGTLPNTLRCDVINPLLAG